MKVILYGLLVFFLLEEECYSQSWIYVGTPGFSSTVTYYNVLAIDNKGTPYVAYTDGFGGSIVVMKYSGTSWVPVGINGDSISSGYCTSLAIDSNGTPYLAYTQGSKYGQKSVVVKFNDTSWVTVGANGFSAGEIDNTSITIDHTGNIYVAFEDFTDSGKATVMKYDGSNWVIVGTPGFSLGTVGYVPLACDPSGAPYIVCGDGTTVERATVMKYDGTNWIVVGNVGFSDSSALLPSIVFDKTGIPYVSYQDGEYGKAMVKELNGNSWVTVGSPDFLDSVAVYTPLAIDKSGNLFLAFTDSDNINAKSTVEKYDGNAWTVVGNSRFSARQTFYLSIAIDRNGIPYVGYSDYGYGQRATVMKYLADTTGINSILNDTICAGNSVSVGSHHYYASGTYIDTLVAFGGGDSIVTLNLFVDSYPTAVNKKRICLGDTFQGHDTAGIYLDTVQSASGCDSLITLELQIDTLPATVPIYQNGDTLSTLSGYQAYNWYEDSAILVASGSNTYVISHSGNYYVTISNDTENCVKSSAVIGAYLLGIEQLQSAVQTLFISPNPSSGIFHISFPEKITAVQVFDVEGRMVMKNNSGPINNNTVINLEGKAKGVYFLRATAADGIINGKLVVE